MKATRPTETWKAIPGYEGFYEVSDQGQVRNVKRSRVVAGSRNHDGYQRLALFRNGQRRFYSVHELVLQAFVGPRPEGMDACHWDDDKQNNSLSNLRWSSRSENMRDNVRNGNHKEARKTECPRGHRLTAPNLAPAQLRRGKRTCRACNRAHTEVSKKPELRSNFTQVADRYYRDLMPSAH